MADDRARVRQAFVEIVEQDMDDDIDIEDAAIGEQAVAWLDAAFAATPRLRPVGLSTERLAEIRDMYASGRVPANRAGAHVGELLAHITALEAALDR